MLLVPTRGGEEYCGHPRGSAEVSDPRRNNEMPQITKKCPVRGKSERKKISQEFEGSSRRVEGRNTAGTRAAARRYPTRDATTKCPKLRRNAPCGEKVRGKRFHRNLRAVLDAWRGGILRAPARQRGGIRPETQQRNAPNYEEMPRAGFEPEPPVPKTGTLSS